MFNVGGGEIIVILLIALIVLGPDKLPGAARQVGKYLNEFRRISSGFQDEIRSAMDETTKSVDPSTWASSDSPPLSPDPAPASPTDELQVDPSAPTVVPSPSPGANGSAPAGDATDPTDPTDLTDPTDQLSPAAFETSSPADLDVTPPDTPAPEMPATMWPEGKAPEAAPEPTAGPKPLIPWPSPESESETESGRVGPTSA